MKQAAILFAFLLIASFTGYAQTIVLEGTQTVDIDKKSQVLNCIPIKITKSMKITAAVGNCDGFWIQKGSITVYRFTKLKDAVGTILKSGTYYVYPNVKKDNKKADISVTIKPTG